MTADERVAKIEEWRKGNYVPPDFDWLIETWRIMRNAHRKIVNMTSKEAEYHASDVAAEALHDVDESAGK